MATIKDIAKATGFSITTVSRALNGYSDVSEKTRKKIKETAERLNYSPNALARSLVQKKSKTIGLLISGLSREGAKDNFTYEVLCGINDITGLNGYDLVLFSTTTSKQKEKTYTQLCRERSVDGVIIMGMKRSDPYLKEIIESDIPCVLVDIPITTDTVGYVASDHKEGARQAVVHLLKLNHRNIAMINGHSEAYVSELRLEGYMEALAGAGIEFKDEWVVDGKYEEEPARQAALTLLREHPEITAIFCASDIMAIGALKAAEQLNRKVPDQLSIVGFDDIVLASYTTPPLTTIAQDKYQLGVSATELIIDLMEGNQPSDGPKKILENQLVIRYSTAKKVAQDVAVEL